jgi:ABC-2 type transport system permease protein
MTTLPTILTGTIDNRKLHSVLSNRSRPKPPNPLTAALIFAWRAVLKIKHVPIQLFDVTAFPIMMTLMFTYLFGGALAGSTREYLQFLLPGILAQTVLFITMYTGTAINTDIQKGIFDRFRSMPVWSPAPLVGALLSDVLRYSIAATVVIVLGLLLGFRPAGGVIGVLSALALILVFAFSLSWIWTTLGLVMPTPEAVMGISSFILFPLTFVSNIFVSPETMPSLVRTLVNLNPVTHLAEAVRGLMHGTPDSGSISIVLIASAVLIAIFGPLTMFLYRNKNAR